MAIMERADGRAGRLARERRGCVLRGKDGTLEGCQSGQPCSVVFSANALYSFEQ